MNACFRRVVDVPLGSETTAKLTLSPESWHDIFAARDKQANGLKDAADVVELRSAVAELRTIGARLDAETAMARSEISRLNVRLLATHKRDSRGAIVFDFARVDSRKPLWSALCAIRNDNGRKLADRAANRIAVRNLEKRLVHIERAQRMA